jgi:hypothetical protein
LWHVGPLQVLQKKEVAEGRPKTSREDDVSSPSISQLIRAARFTPCWSFRRSDANHFCLSYSISRSFL